MSPNGARLEFPNGVSVTGDRQTPSGAEVYLDHVGWFIPDITKASLAFERMGFVLTPFAISRNADATGALEPTGLGNRCAMLRRGYLEIVAAIDGVETELARRHRVAIAHHSGVHVVSFTVVDVAAARERLTAEGFDPIEPVRLRRPIRADGIETFAQFTVLRVPPEKMPEGRIQFLTQETPELIWQDALITRDNAISGLTGVLFCVEDPLQAANRYGRFVGREARRSGDYCDIVLDRGRLAFASPSSCRTLIGGRLLDPGCVAAVSLSADNLAAAHGFLRHRAVPVSGGAAPAFFIGPEDAGGTTLAIHDSSYDWPDEN